MDGINQKLSNIGNDTRTETVIYQSSKLERAIFLFTYNQNSGEDSLKQQNNHRDIGYSSNARSEPALQESRDHQNKVNNNLNSDISSH